jgi:MarR family transcriptional regulator, organic hydroperoxide resistance regulator
MYNSRMTDTLRAELKQTKPFPRRSAEALLSVLRTAALLEHQMGEVLKPHGITTTQYNVLRILRGAGREGLCGRDIGERMVSKVPDVSRLLDRMEEMGLIRRVRDDADRRHVTARITPKGVQVVADATPPLEAVERARFGRIDARRLDAVITALEEVRGAGA